MVVIAALRPAPVCRLVRHGADAWKSGAMPLVDVTYERGVFDGDLRRLAESPPGPGRPGG